MTATLLTGAAGQGKTQAAVLKAKLSIGRKPFGKIWVLLPTHLQIMAFRTRLLQEIGDAACFGVEYFDFYRLYERLLELAGVPQRQVQDAARFRILRHVLAEIEAQLVYFRPIAQTPGFVAVTTAFIQELKQAQIRPEDLTAVAQTPKDRDLAAIYTGYQDFLRDQDLVDGEGEGWLALARLRDSAAFPLNVDLLIIDGYDQFTRVQAELLALLAGSVRNTLLTLTYQPERAVTAHRRYAQTRTQLLDYGVWTEKPLGSQRPPARAASLDHLSESLFDTHPTRLPNDGALSLIEAPDRRREVQTVLKRVKRLLLSGTAPEQITILSRDLQPYTPYFLETVPAYGVQLAMRRGSPLTENPAVAALLALLDLPDNAFPRRATIDVLRSPYLACPDLNAEQIDALDRISRARAVVRGRQQWLEAVDMEGQAHPAQEGDEGEPPANAISPDEAAALRNGIERFFNRISPPANAIPRDYVRWLESLIGPDPLSREDAADDTPPVESFQMIAHIRTGAPHEITARDLAALECLKQHVFRDVLAAYELIDAWSPVIWEAFWLDLRIALNNATINPSRTAHRTGRVLLASIYEARGLPHDHVFLIGLSEGEFPARVAEDALYTDSERQRMKDQHIPLITRAEAADESSLFYEVTALARQTLTLTRPYIDDKGNEWPASPYWRAVRAVVEVEPERLPIAAPDTLDEAARLAEVMTALAQGLNESLTPALAGVHNWLLDQPERAACWMNALWGRWIESRRGSPHVAHDGYTGHLSNPALLARIGEMLGPDYTWSASQFNDYGLCPFKFFARRLLKLEAVKEPQEGMDQLQHGSLLHEILEYTYRQIGTEQLAIVPDNRARALQILNDVTDERLVGAPERYGFRASATWLQEQAEIRRKLRKMVEKDFSDDNPLGAILPGERHTYLQEVSFGYQQDVIIDGGAGPLKVRGYIDRVDIADGQISVIDYKSGSTPISTEDMLEGRNVQMMLYILATQQDFPGQKVAGAAFWILGKNTLSGQITADDPLVQDARHALHERINRARRGVFINAPNIKPASNYCAQYCDFSQLCRADRVSAHKPVNDSMT